MKYLTVDGFVSGTGIRNTFEGGYLRLEDLELSTELKDRISNWLSRYEEQHYKQYKNRSTCTKLDTEGIELSNLLKIELPDSKVEYYSSATMKRLIPKD